MNFWGFPTAFLDRLWEGLSPFLAENLPANPLKCEYFLPSVVNARIAAGGAAVEVLPCEETWYGVTYREDLDSVRSAIAGMYRDGVYPDPLWT